MNKLPTVAAYPWTSPKQVPWTTPERITAFVRAQPALGEVTAPEDVSYLYNVLHHGYASARCIASLYGVSLDALKTFFFDHGRLAPFDL